VLGGPGIIEELQARGVSTARPDDADGSFDAVVVGMDPSFDYGALAAAASALHGGARLVGTNEDATFPTPKGLFPGAGSLLAAVACAGQTEPIVAGKPHSPTVGLVRERIGEVEIVVGDRASTDGLLARRLETRFGLVLTGVTRPGHGALDPDPDLEAPDLLSLVNTAGL
jgi:4-nitrophenyl phosphatase